MNKKLKINNFGVAFAAGWFLMLKITVFGYLTLEFSSKSERT
jgi:tRNA A37 threonylcarbamoyladenosine modification protein TsaB